MPEQTPQVPTFTDRLLSFMALPTETDPKVNMVLLGSGSSIEAGYPGGSDLDRIFREAGLRVYSEIATATLPAERPDVERVLRVMEHLAEYQADSLAHDLSMLGITLGKLSMYGNTPEQLADRCAAEVHAILQLLRKNLWKRWPLPPLKEPAKAQKWDYLKPMIKALRGSTIATLNYDNSIELAGWPSMVSTVRKKSNLVEIPEVGFKSARLLKLHGSLDWQRAEDDVLRNAAPLDDYDYEPGIIFGSGNKLRSYGPFLELLRNFHDSLAAATRLVVIGYSWRDPHINAEIHRWAKAGTPKTLYVGLLEGQSLAQPVTDMQRQYSNLTVERRIGPASKVIARLFPDTGSTSGGTT